MRARVGGEWITGAAKRPMGDNEHIDDMPEPTAKVECHRFMYIVHRVSAMIFGQCSFLVLVSVSSLWWNTRRASPRVAQQTVSATEPREMTITYFGI